MLERLTEHFKDRLTLAAALLTSASVQLAFISKSSIWHDEGYSLLLAPHNLANIVERTARDVHPPFYYLLLHFWIKLFGSSELGARSLSTLAIVATIFTMFYLVRWLFGEGAARLTVIFLALAPFLIRYGQEARMYALLAFLITLATYLLVRAVMTHQARWLYLYALVMTLAFYTHYYTVFMVVAHWLYVLIQSRRAATGKSLIKSWHWWGANFLIVLLFSPWLPVAYRQFTRVQSGFWIGPVSVTTLPSTLGQFLHFTSLGQLPVWLRVGLGLLFIGLIAATILKDKVHDRRVSLLALWALTGPVAVFAVSALSRPIYVDRYFVFSAVAFYALLAVMLYLKPLNRYVTLRWLLASLIVLVMTLGIRNVYLQSNHKMRDIGQAVGLRYGAGDELVAGELYVYLDFSYYNHTGHELKLYAPGGINGYGETSLLYDKPQLILNSWQALAPASGYVWVIGKAGDKDYFKAVPSNWRLVEHYQAGESVANRYLVSPRVIALLQ